MTSAKETPQQSSFTLSGSAPFLKSAPPSSLPSLAKRERAEASLGKTLCSGLPMRHFAFAAFAFWIFSAEFALHSSRLLGFDFEALWVLGLVHSLTLGFIAMTILGVMIQMSSVLWEIPLQAPHRLISLCWWGFSSGLATFVYFLWSGRIFYWIPAALAALSLMGYIAIFIRTMFAAKKIDWTGKHLAISSAYLISLAILGVLLAYDRERGVIFPDPQGALIAHIHLALIGWVSLSIIGVSYRLVSMFALSHLESKTPGRLALFLLNVGLLGLVWDSLWNGHRFLPLWASLLSAAYFIYALQMFRIFKERMRKLDPSLSFTILALFGGALWSALGLGLSFGWIKDSVHAREAYIASALLGWVTPFILGEIHKIVPFLVWLHVYSPQNFKPPVRVPKISDLTSQKLAWGELIASIFALIFVVVGFLVKSRGILRLGAFSWFLVATLYAINTAISLKHLLWKDPRWS
jgi:hypothetical protein